MECPGHLWDLLEAEQLVTASLSPGTQVTYRHDWCVWEDWSSMVGFSTGNGMLLYYCILGIVGTWGGRLLKLTGACQG